MILLTIVYGRNKPFSKVFHTFNSNNKILGQAKELNRKRLESAKNYLSSSFQKDRPFYSNSPELAIVIVTVKRQAYDSSRLGYVLQTVAATHKLFTHDRAFTNKTMIICNVDLKPDNFTEIASLKHFVPTLERYGHSTFSVSLNRTRANLYKNTYYSNKYDKETVDYMYCLEAAYSLGAKYVLLMEDDALPRMDTLDVLKIKISYLNRKLNGRYSYIKLYYPQRWQGYAYEKYRILEIVSIGCVGAGVFLLLHLMMCNSKFYCVRLTYFLLGAWLFVTMAMLVGRQNVYDLYRISDYLYTLKDSPGCCTQAMVYNRQFIPAIIDFLSLKHKNLHTDLAIYNFTNVTKIPAYQIEPNLFFHVGMYTSLSSEKHKNAEEFIFDAL